MSVRGPKGVLFDLDDTLIDRRASLEAYSLAILRDFSAVLRDIPAPAVFDVLHREDDGGYRVRPEFFRRVLDGLPWKKTPSVEAMSEHWRENFPRHCSVPRAGMQETITWLNDCGIEIGLVTNGASESQQAKVDAIGIRRYLRVVIVSGEVGVAKPEPQIFQTALTRLGLNPAEVWFVGDHPEKDIAGARNAGMTAVWMKAQHAWPADVEPPGMQVSSLTELRLLLE